MTSSSARSIGIATRPPQIATAAGAAAAAAPHPPLLLLFSPHHTYSISVDGVALLLEADEGVFVDVVGGDDHEAPHPGQLGGSTVGDLLEDGARRRRQIGQITRVDPDAWVDGNREGDREVDRKGVREDGNLNAMLYCF